MVSALKRRDQDDKVGFVRKYLSADGLLSIVKHGLRREKFKTIKNTEYTWEDCVMSGLAVFGFKMPSLLQFEKDKVAEPLIRRNLRTLYGVEKAPSDTCMRERLDVITPQQLRRPFKQIFSYLQRGKALEKYRYLDGHYIISIDGTGQYSSEKVFCECCCEKHHRNGHVEYYHQMYWSIGKRKNRGNGNILVGSLNSISQKKMSTKSCVQG